MGDERKHHSMIVLPDDRLWILGGANKYANALETTEFLSKVSQSDLYFLRAKMIDLLVITLLFWVQ